MAAILTLSIPYDGPYGRATGVLMRRLKALEAQDWTEIASAITNPEDPLFSEAAEETFDALRERILQLEQEAEAERH